MQEKPATDNQYWRLEAPMATAPPPQFLTVTEVAEVMRVSKMTVYRLIHAGELPAIRVGRSFRVPTAAVKQLLDITWSDEQQGEVGR